MYFSTDISVLLYASSFIVGGIVAAAPLCSETINSAGGGPPSSVIPTAISSCAIKELQLAYFLENVEASFFNAGLNNLTEWDTSGLPNDTSEVITKIAAVSTPTTKYHTVSESICSKKRSICPALRTFFNSIMKH